MFNFNNILSRIMEIGTVQRQSIISLIWQIIFTLVGLLSTMYFSHTVGADILGAYFLFMAYLGIINMVTDGGFGGAAIKRISEGDGYQDAYFSAFFIVRSLFVVIVVLVLIIFRGFFVDFNKAGTFGWLLIALIISVFYGAVSYGLAGKGKMGIYSTCNFINNISRIIAQVIAIYLGYGIAGLAGGFVFGMIVTTIIGFHFFDLHLAHFNSNHIKSLSIFSFWLFLTGSGWLVFSYADTVMIGYFKNNADVGIYRIAINFATMATFTSQAILPTLLPRVSRWSKIGEIGLIEASLSRAFSYSFLLAIPVLGGGILLGDRLLYYLFGAEFAKGYTVLVIILIVQIVNIFNLCFGTYLGALDRQKQSFKVTAVAVVANIVLNFILIPVIGIVGASLATLISMFLNAILARHELAKIMKIRIEYDSLLNFIKASVIMSIFVAGYRLFVPLANIWLTILPVILGGAIYGILILEFDSIIYGDLKDITTKMNLRWPTIFFALNKK